MNTHASKKTGRRFLPAALDFRSLTSKMGRQVSHDAKVSVNCDITVVLLLRCCHIDLYQRVNAVDTDTFQNLLRCNWLEVDRKVTEARVWTQIHTATFTAFRHAAVFLDFLLGRESWCVWSCEFVRVSNAFNVKITVRTAKIIKRLCRTWRIAAEVFLNSFSIKI